jgi:hypothetical protein
MADISLAQALLVALVGGGAGSALTATSALRVQSRQMDHDREERERQFARERRLRTEERGFATAGEFLAAADLAFQTMLENEAAFKRSPLPSTERRHELAREANQHYDAFAHTFASMRLVFQPGSPTLRAAWKAANALSRYRTCIGALHRLPDSAHAPDDVGWARLSAERARIIARERRDRFGPIAQREVGMRLDESGASPQIESG